MDNSIFQGITTSSPKIMNSHQMEKLLKKGHFGVIAQLHAIQAVEAPSPTVHIDIQSLLSKHQSIYDNP
jgi:hypothetical protein